MVLIDRYFIGLAIASAWGIILTSVAAFLGDVPKLTSVGWLIVFLATTFAGILIWIAVEFMLLIRQRRRSSVPSNPVIADTQSRQNPKFEEEKPRPVEFWLSSNWGPGFRLNQMGDDGSGSETQGEEIVLKVSTKEKLQNARFEIAAKHLVASKWEVISQISSAKFLGIVPKGMDQSFVLMRRTFWNVHTRYKRPNSEVNEGIHVRVEKNVMFFPENPQGNHRVN